MAIQTAIVTVTAAQLNALDATPITIVAAPGAGLVIEPLWCVFNYVHGSAAFTVGSSALVLCPAGSVGVYDWSYFVPSAGFIDQTSNQIFLAFSDPSSNFPSSAILNTGLVLGNTGGNTSGGSGSSLVITLLYNIISGS